MTMAEQIIRARKKAGLTQRELAKQLNVTNKAVSRWETGGGMPDIIQLVPLCRVLDLSLQELLDGVEEGLGKQFISSLLIQQMDENKNINTETLRRAWRPGCRSSGRRCLQFLLPLRGHEAGWILSWPRKPFPRLPADGSVRAAYR